MSEPSRNLWEILEPIHALTYFSKEAAQAFEDVGLHGFWRGYFAGRAGPLGQVDGPPVTALFYGFERSFVARAVPDVWRICPPEIAIEARQTGAASSIRALAPGRFTKAMAERANELLAPTLPLIRQGRTPLGLANAVLSLPEDPYERLWHLCTAVREHRGDGHVAALVIAQLGPCESTTLRCAAVGIEVGRLRTLRGWSDQQWDDAKDRLTDRGLLKPERNLAISPTGSELVEQVEATTDRLAAPVAESVKEASDELFSLLLPLAALIGESGLVPYPNPIGVTRPSNPT